MMAPETVQNGQANDDKIFCVECRQQYSKKKADEIMKATGRREFFIGPDGPLCASRADCRARQISNHFSEKGIKRWSRRSLETLLNIMDCPPADWDPKKEWVPLNEPWERVEAALERFSLCYPVCTLYAVEVDADGEPIKHYGGFKGQTIRSLAKILSTSPMTVQRAIVHLKARHRIWEKDGQYGIELDPKSLSFSERVSCTRGMVPGKTPPDDPGFRALLPSSRKALQAALHAADPVSCTRLRLIATYACTGVNQRISIARTWGSELIEEAIHDPVSLLSRDRDLETYVRTSAPAHDSPDARAQAGNPVSFDGGRQGGHLPAEAGPAKEAGMSADGGMAATAVEPEVPPAPDPTPDPPRPPLPELAAQKQVLNAAIPAWQARFPDSKWNDQPFEVLAKRDCELVRQIVEKLDATPADYFVSHVNNQVLVKQPTFPFRYGLGALVEVAGVAAKKYAKEAERRQEAERQQIEYEKRHAADRERAEQEGAEAEARFARWSAISERHKLPDGRYDVQAIADDPELDEQGRRMAQQHIQRLGRYTEKGI